MGFEVDIELVALHLVSLPLFHCLEGVVEKMFVDRLEK